MTKAEAAKILAYLYADTDTTVPEAKIAVWADQFAHIPYSVALVAARLMLSRRQIGNKFRAWEFADAIREVTTPEGREITGAEAFEIAMRTVARFGYTRQEEGLATLPPLVRQATERFGWDELRLCESPELIRGQFARVYESISSQDRAERTLRPELSNQIAVIRQHVAGGGSVGSLTAETISAGLIGMCKPKGIE